MMEHFKGNKKVVRHIPTKDTAKVFITKACHHCLS